MKQKRIYTSLIDNDFDPKNDIALGAWCYNSFFSYPGHDPFRGDKIERETLHFQLYNLAKRLFLESPQKDHNYLFKEFCILTFFAYDRYRRLQIITSLHQGTELLIQKPTTIISQRIDFWHFQLNNNNVMLSYLIYKLINPNLSIRIFKNKNNHKSKKIPKKASIKYSIISRIKLYIDKFLRYKINGVNFSINFFFTVINIILLFFRRPQEKKHYLSIEQDTPENLIEFSSILQELITFYIQPQFYKKSSFYLPNYCLYPPQIIFDQDKGFQIFHEQKTKKKYFISYQHGSFYGTMQKHIYREIEALFCYKFIMWGSEAPFYEKLDNIINYLPIPYLSFLADKYKFHKDNKKILWVTGISFKGGDGIENIDGHTAWEYISKKKAFWEGLPIHIAESIQYKTLGHIEGIFPDVLIDIIPKNQQIKSNIIPLMKKTKIVFIDYYGTPFYEAMSLNAPTILGLFEEIPCFTDVARDLFQRFEDAGVVYRTPSTAASFINSLESMDIEKWWKQEKIQRLRQEFLEKYANNKPYFWPWTRAILKGEI